MDCNCLATLCSLLVLVLTELFLLSSCCSSEVRRIWSTAGLLLLFSLLSTTITSFRYTSLLLFNCGCFPTGKQDNFLVLFFALFVSLEAVFFLGGEQGFSGLLFLDSKQKNHNQYLLLYFS